MILCIASYQIVVTNTIIVIVFYDCMYMYMMIRFSHLSCDVGNSYKLQLDFRLHMQS